MDERVVRRPRAEDAEAMGELHVRAWQVAYRGMMPAEYLDGLDPAVRTEMWSGAIERNPSRLLVAEVAGAVVGFAAFGPEAVDDEHPPPDAAPRGELYAINLHPDAWGRSTGRTLLREVQRQLADDGFDIAVLWVVPENERAIALYASEGWEADGARRSDDVLGVAVAEMRMRCRLD